MKGFTFTGFVNLEQFYALKKEINDLPARNVMVTFSNHQYWFYVYGRMENTYSEVSCTMNKWDWDIHDILKKYGFTFESGI